MGLLVGVLETRQFNKSILRSMRNLLVYREGEKMDNQYVQFSNSTNCYRYVSMVSNECIDSKLIIAIDGAIYNAKELYVHLSELHIDCVNKTNANLFLYLYRMYGFKRALQMLDGAFAISLLDLNRQVMYIARDRFGIKPIYYYRKDEIFLFASEYKAFYCHPAFKPVLNHDAVSEYFIFRYPAGEQTFIKDVYLVKPATYLEISKNGVMTQTYWKLPRPKLNKLAFEENKQIIKDYISTSITRRLRDVCSIGVQLSGGVDSSYLAALIREQTRDEMHAYSVVMEDKSISEEEFIDVVNQKLALHSHKLMLDANLFFQNWEKATWFYESPLQHEGNVPLLRLNSEAAKQVSILFCGDGADETMGGYNRFPMVMRYYSMRQKIRWYRSQLVNIIKGRTYKSLDDYFISLSQFLSDNDIKELRPNTYKKDIKKVYAYRKSILSACHSSSALHRYLEYEMVTYLRDTLLRGDKMASASNIEMRAPLLMHELIEFMQTVPAKYLVDQHKKCNYNTKILLKSLCSDVYGDEFTYRNKVGLGIPMHTILKDEKIQTFIENNLLPGIKKRRIVNYSYVKSIWEQVCTINSNADTRIQVLWLAFSFEMWAQMYIDNSPINKGKI